MHECDGLDCIEVVLNSWPQEVTTTIIIIDLDDYTFYTIIPVVYIFSSGMADVLVFRMVVWNLAN